MAFIIPGLVVGFKGIGERGQGRRFVIKHWLVREIKKTLSF